MSTRKASKFVIILWSVLMPSASTSPAIPLARPAEFLYPYRTSFSPMKQYIPNLKSLAFAAVAVLTISFAFGQEEGQAIPAAVMQKKAAEQKPPEKKPGDLKKYDEVITKEAKTQPGLFKVHRIDEKVYWEIPADKLGRDLLWQAEIAELPASVGFPGTPAGTSVLKFTRRNNKLLLRTPDYSVRSAANDGTDVAIRANAVEPVIMQFDILTEGENKSAVIDVTPLFTTDPGELSVKGAIGMSGADPNRSYVDKVKAFPNNIETRSFITFMPGGPRGFFGGPSGPASVTVHYSLDLLPEKPMMGRLKDSRIGFFTTDFDEFGRPENRVTQRRYITRFRLEKKDPNAEVSEPVKPIVFYLSREVPFKWRQHIKKGIEDWQPVFEAAGFKNAIIAKDAPSVKEDPDWDPEDLRYSVIRWAPSRTENAIGPSIQDPRSGETISAHVIVWNDIVKLAEEWYFAQAGAVDPVAWRLPLDDAKLGSLVQTIVTHEVGHTLGLEHNFKASTAYTIPQLRDKGFMKTHGVSASIMSYSRFDYVAQPEDNVPEMRNLIGPYDYFAIHYGYAPIADAKTPDAEKPTLDKWLSQQVADSSLRFGNYVYYGVDPTTQMENISNDPVEAARLGFKNLDRIAKNFLVNASTKPGEDYDMLNEMHQQLIGQRITELLHITPIIGGVVETDYHAGRGGDVFAPVSSDKQAAAVKFIVTRGFETPTSLFDPAVLNKVRPEGLVDFVSGLQEMVMRDMLSSSRMHRMQDNEAANGAKAYTVDRLVSDITGGVWSELNSVTPKVDVYRRSLQRAYLSTMDTKINGYGANGSDIKALGREALKSVAKRIDVALPKATDKLTYAHLANCRHDIEQILTNKYATEGSGGNFGMFLGYHSQQSGLKNCWAAGATISETIKRIIAEDHLKVTNTDKK